MKIFHRDFVAERENAKAALSAARQRLNQLHEQRKVAAGEAVMPLSELGKIGRHIEDAKSSISLLEDRMGRLRTLERKAELEKRQAARDAAIASVIQPQLMSAKKIAERFEASLGAVADDFKALSAVARDLGFNWPQAVPKPAFWDGAFSISAIRSRVTSALSYASNGSVERVLEFANINHELGIAASVRRQCDASLEELKHVEIVLPPEPDDADLSELAKAEQPRGLAAIATAGVA